MLALLGWNPGTEQEIFSLEELSQIFSLERVSKSGAKFSPDKTKWFNQQYLHKKSDTDLAKLFTPILIEKGVQSEQNYIEKVVGLVKERATFVNDFWELSHFFFQTPESYDAKAIKKQWKENTPEIMTELAQKIESISDFTSENLEKEVKEWIQNKELGFGKVMQPLRLSLVGAMQGPAVFDIMEMVGKEESLHRIHLCIEKK